MTALENYGVEWHSVRDSEGQKLLIGVGPEGISICKDDFSPINRYVLCGSVFHFSELLCVPLVLYINRQNCSELLKGAIAV